MIRTKQNVDDEWCSRLAVTNECKSDKRIFLQSGSEFILCWKSDNIDNSLNHALSIESWEIREGEDELNKNS